MAGVDGMVRVLVVSLVDGPGAPASIHVLIAAMSAAGKRIVIERHARIQLALEHRDQAAPIRIVRNDGRSMLAALHEVFVVIQHEVAFVGSL